MRTFTDTSKVTAIKGDEQTIARFLRWVRFEADYGQTHVVDANIMYLCEKYGNDHKRPLGWMKLAREHDLARIAKENEKKRKPFVPA